MSDKNWRQQQAAAQRREEVLAALERYIAERGYSPTKEELAEICGIGLTALRKHLKVLVEDGRVIDPGGQRSLRLGL